jgi:hypothetical protein
MFSGTLLPNEALTVVTPFVAKNQGVFTLIDALRQGMKQRQV